MMIKNLLAVKSWKCAACNNFILHLIKAHLVTLSYPDAFSVRTRFLICSSALAAQTSYINYSFWPL